MFRRLTFATSFAVALGAMAPGLCVCAETRQAESSDVSALILAPLRDELQLQADLTATRDVPSALGAGSAFHDFPGEARADMRPAALRLALTALDLRAESRAIEGFTAFRAPAVTLAKTPSGGRFSVSRFDVQKPDVGLPALPQSHAGIVSSGGDRASRRMALRYETIFDAPGGFDGLDVRLAPHAGVSFGENGSATEAGATVRLGRYLGEGFGDNRPAWWFFAGVDRQALMIDPDAGLNLRDALVFEPHAMMGDAQAGMAARLGGANVSIAYVRRETRYAMPAESWETIEGFAAVSVTVRR